MLVAIYTPDMHLVGQAEFRERFRDGEIISLQVTQLTGIAAPRTGFQQVVQLDLAKPAHIADCNLRCVEPVINGHPTTMLIIEDQQLGEIAKRNKNQADILIQAIEALH